MKKQTVTEYEIVPPSSRVLMFKNACPDCGMSFKDEDDYAGENCAECDSKMVSQKFWKIIGFALLQELPYRPEYKDGFSNY